RVRRARCVRNDGCSARREKRAEPIGVKSRMKNSIFLSLAAFGLLGCTEPNPAFNPDPLLPGECRAGNRAEQSFDAYERPEKLDVLILVDSSGDVERMQDKFAQAAQPWLEDLKARGLDVWAAVTTTDLDG